MAQDTDGEEDNGAHQFERSTDGDADDAEREQQEPDEIG